MTATKLLNQVDRWGTVLLIYLLPWQARLIFRQGTLAGAPSEPQTLSLFALEVLILIMTVVRLAAMAIEKDKVRRSRCYSFQFIKGIFVALGALVVLSLVSTVVSADLAATFLAAIRLAEGLAVLFLVMTAPDENEARLAFVVSALVQAAIALVQVLFQHVYPSVWLGIAAHFPETAGTSVVETVGSRFLRAYGTLPHPNILGGMLAIAILAARPLFRRVSLLGIGVYGLLGAGLFFSFSRLAWLALAVGLLVQWLYARRDLVFLKHAAAAVIVLLFCSALFWPLVAARTSAAGRLETKSIAARISSLHDAFEIIKYQPLSGVGAGAFTAAVWKQVDPKRNGYDLEPAHSAPVEVWAELGIFGLLLYIWLLYLTTRLAWKSGKIGLATTLLMLASLDHWSWTTFAGLMIFWAGWGLTRRGCQDHGIIQKAGALILSQDDPGKLLLLYRSGLNYCDWTFPKGHMEPGESREDTMRREVKEETGLDVKIIRTLPPRSYTTGTGHPAMNHLFLVRSLDDSRLRLEPGFPDNKLEWLPIDEVEARLTFENQKEYFRSIRNIVERGSGSKTGS